MNAAQCLVVSLLLLQAVPRQRAPRQPQTASPQGANAEAIATFTGVFKSADKKYVTVEVEDGNSMRMFITGATKFIRDGKPAKAADFHSGEPVTVDTSRDARFNLLAMRVEAGAPKTPSPPPEK